VTILRAEVRNGRFVAVWVAYGEHSGRVAEV
jgi:hypothetical protein